MKQPALTLEDAQARLLALAEPVSIQRTDISSALGHFLAEPLIARRTQPAADLSAMDGYAVAAGDFSGPWRLVGESAAGHPFCGSVAPGQVVRISTGALLPEGAHGVILQEDVSITGDEVKLTGEPPHPQDKHVRRAGLDFRLGKTVLEAGIHLGPAQVALAVSAGYRHVPVRRRLRITVLDTGDELTDDCENCGVGQVPASNGPMLAAMAASLPCDVERIGPVQDRMEDLLVALDRSRDADILVTSGGASVGDHDLIRPALEQAGAQINFWRVAIKPGKPLLIARRPRSRGSQIVVGLPGNPVSSHVTAYLFLLPLMRAMLGATAPLPHPFDLRLATRIGPAGSRREFIRGTWNGAGVVPARVQDSGALSALATSNVLIERLPGEPAADEGEMVRAYLLGNCGMT